MTAGGFDDVNDFDAVPPTESIGYPCEVCGREAGPYSGRGRKPKYCDLHKPNRSKSASTPRPTGKSAELARQAAEVLVQANQIGALGASLVGYTATGETIVAAQDGFREAVERALVIDPELCRQILKGGSVSGKAALVVAYGMMFAVVLPVARMEQLEKKAEKIARAESMGE